ncbi:glutaredoxin family protein [Phormidium pseudopriestleyi FRX01]|uniref:Glutaredoxin family protein n=1 Tax=Phormidium pseudopriestleyi FRX01 TaxID=1759528 RepID=A0ABS3FV81_9CYAN|nr:glutaredoxin family protein [Phormidium pseudopriestleyi]MBO0351034.1 glutaredoxin family protein [Phormidium pseudopriestleyi FRX01]
MRLILYSKPDCHLCEGLQEKLEQIQDLNFELEVRDITTQADWFAAYEYEIPVLCCVSTPDPDAEIPPKEEPLPRPSPRASVEQVQQMLQQYFPKNDSK